MKGFHLAAAAGGRQQQSRRLAVGQVTLRSRLVGGMLLCSSGRTPTCVWCGSKALSQCNSHHNIHQPQPLRLCVPAGEVIQLKAQPGATFSIDELKAAVKEHKPAILFLVQVGHREGPPTSFASSFCTNQQQQQHP